MKRFLWLLLFSVLVIFPSYAFLTKRSVTVWTGTDGPSVTYTVAWGWGMEERISIKKRDAFFSASSAWSKVWKKPYNAGATLFRTADQKTLYISLRFNIYRFEIDTGTLTTLCGARDSPAPTSLLIALRGAGNSQTAKEIDPDGKSSLGYVAAVDNQAIPSNPPKSRYYLDLEYLGRFGVIRSEGRGSDVGFMPANQETEPQNGLYGSCG